MKPFLLFALISSALIPPPVRGEDAPSTRVNPALLYWQAAAVLPKLSDDEAAKIRDMARRTVPADAAALDSLHLDSTENLLRRAAGSTAPCDWGLLREDGPAMLMPHLAKIRELANIATARAEVLFQQGKVDEALEWLLVTHHIARHSGVGETLISYLVQISIEEMAIRSAARHCLGWNEAARHAYAAKLQDLPPLQSFQQSYRGESLFLDWLDRLNNSDRAEKEKKLEAVFASSSSNAEGASEQVAKLRPLLDAETLRRELTAAREFHARVTAAAGKPWLEAHPELEAILQDAKKSDSLLVHEVVPAAISIKEKESSTATLSTMLRAALEKGPALTEISAATNRDAFEGQPIQLKKSAEGAVTLLSKPPKPDGKSVELILGR